MLGNLVWASFIFLGSRYPLHRLMWFHAWVGEKVLCGTGIQFRPGKWAVEFRHNSIWPLLFSSTHSFVRLLQKAHNKDVSCARLQVPVFCCQKRFAHALLQMA